MVLAQFLFNDADGVYVRILRKLLKCRFVKHVEQ